MFIMRDLKKETKEFSATKLSKEKADLFKSLSDELKEQKKNEEIEKMHNVEMKEKKDVKKVDTVEEVKLGCSYFAFLSKLCGSTDVKILI